VIVSDSPDNSQLQAALTAFGEFAAPPERHTIANVGDFARLDLDRQAQSGKPEVIYAASKTPEQVVAIAERLLAAHGRAIVSRLGEAQHEALVAAFAGADGGVVIERRAGYPTAVVRRADAPEIPVAGHVGILTAGTTDLPAADEARVMAEAMGCRVSLVADVGVAGLARLFGPLRALLDGGAGALIVVAGMDGALPSVVAGLSPVPVVGLPTSTGYGAGGAGVAALLAMLQTCAPGLTVVNIDNGIGAGAAAALIARGAAR
jgi:NCAIR mutase (PurE)-related protein